MESATQHPTQFEIFVDDVRLVVHQPSMTGAQIKAAASKDASYQLFEEVRGGKDIQIGDNQAVQIKNGEHFYTVPPATFGT